MFLLIDNYDSFTYNLVHFLGELGIEVEVRRNDVVSVDEALALKPEAIVISPGPGVPERAGICLDLVARAGERQLPVLGVCLGHQVIGQAFGGKIIRAPKPMHGKVDDIRHNGTDVFQGLPNPLVATRYHSLVVERDTIPKSFKITAWTDKTVMAVENKEKKLYGVQFHPESILTSQGKIILNNFLKSV